MSNVFETLIFGLIITLAGFPLTAARNAAHAESSSIEKPVAKPKQITVIGHRGNSSHFPENTLSSFRSAIEAKADYAELDAYPSADGTLWVLHDDTLERTTNIGKHVRRSPAADAGKKPQKTKITATHDDVLRQLDAGSWFDKKFTGEKLPTLAEALDTIQKHGKTLLERKEGDASAYSALLKSKKLVGKLTVQAFDWDFLGQLHKLLPNQPLAALGSKELDDARVAQLPATGVKTVAWEFKFLDRDKVADLHRRGYVVWTWTVDEPADWQRLLDDGVDGIITNRPGELRRWLDSGKPSRSQPRAATK